MSIRLIKPSTGSIYKHTMCAHSHNQTLQHKHSCLWTLCLSFPLPFVLHVFVHSARQRRVCVYNFNENRDITIVLKTIEESVGFYVSVRLHLHRSIVHKCPNIHNRVCAWERTQQYTVSCNLNVEIYLFLDFIRFVRVSFLKPISIKTEIHCFVYTKFNGIASEKMGSVWRAERVYARVSVHDENTK